MMKRMICFVVASVLVGGVASAGLSITTADGSGADTYVANDSQRGPNSNFGTSGLNVRVYNTVRIQVPYIKFDLSGATGDLTGATLQICLTGANRARTWTIYGLNDNATDDAWGESTITYNNAPGMLAATLGTLSLDTTKLTQLGTLAVPASVTAPGTLVTSATATLNLDSFLAADTNKLVTLVIVAGNDSSGTWYIGNKESTTVGVTAPTLLLPNATAVPEPATLAILGLGGLLAARRRNA
jgi:hypothetical protein